MKRYSVSYMRVVGRHSSKTGLRFSYEGRTDNPQEAIDFFESHPLEARKKEFQGREYIDAWFIGLKIVDSKTKEVVYQSQRVNDSDELKQFL